MPPRPKLEPLAPPRHAMPMIDEIKLATDHGLNVAFRRDPESGGLAMQVYEDLRVGGRWIERVIPRELLYEIEHNRDAAVYFADVIRTTLASIRPALGRKIFDDPGSVPLDYQI